MPIYQGDFVHKGTKLSKICNTQINLYGYLLGPLTSVHSAEAAKFAANFIEKEMLYAKNLISAHNLKPSPKLKADILGHLKKVLLACDKAMEAEWKKKGTANTQFYATCSIALALSDLVFMVNVGHGKVFNVSNGEVIHATQVKNSYSEKLAKAKEPRSVHIGFFDEPTEYLGSGKASAEIINVPIGGDSVFLIATPNFHRKINLKSILDQQSNLVLKTMSPEQGAKKFVTAASQNNSSENIALFIVKHGDFPKSSTADTDKKRSYIDQFKTMPFFLPMLDDAALLEKFNSVVSSRKLKKDHVLFEKGDESHEFYIIVEGSIDALNANSGHYRVTAGFVAGEIGVLKNETRWFTARALEDTEVLIVKRDQIAPLLKNPVSRGKIFEGAFYDLSNKFKLAYVK